GSRSDVAAHPHLGAQTTTDPGGARGRSSPSTNVPRGPLCRAGGLCSGEWVGATRALLLLLRSTAPAVAVDDEPSRMRATGVLFAMKAMPGLRLGASLLVGRLVRARDAGA